MIQQDALERSVRIKYIRPIAFSLARQRPLIDRLSKCPSKNWPQSFYKRYPELRASKSETLNWNRYNIYEKVAHWFEAIEKLNSIKVLVGKDNKRGYRGARVKRTTITAIECVSAVGRYLNPMIIWLAATHRAN